MEIDFPEKLLLCGRVDFIVRDWTFKILCMGGFFGVVSDDRKYNFLVGVLHLEVSKNWGMNLEHNSTKMRRYLNREIYLGDFLSSIGPLGLHLRSSSVHPSTVRYPARVD